MTDDKTPIDPHCFNELKRDAMYQDLRKYFPEAAKGKSRARRAVLMETYAKEYATWQRYNFNSRIDPQAVEMMNSPTGRLASKPNDPERPWSEEVGEGVDEVELPSTDYEMLELRVFAALRSTDAYRHLADRSDDELYDEFGTRDLYVAMASLVYSIPAEEVTSAQRNSVKNMTFHERYKSSPQNPPEGVSPEDWEALRAKFHEVFPGLARLMRSDVKAAEERLKEEHTPPPTPAREQRALVDMHKGRRDEVEAALSKLRTRDLGMIDEWKRIPPINRHLKRRRAKLAKKIRKILPKGVTLGEAAQVV